MKFIGRIVDNTRKDSTATVLRRRRMNRFWKLVDDELSAKPYGIDILDVGGTENFWQMVGMPDPRCRMTILNLTGFEPTQKHVRSVVGDARQLRDFHDKQFDIVFSNSVIEHVGSWSDQIRMAREIHRVGRRKFIQTPNLYFPIEPHFVFPFFQFLPMWVRVNLVRRFSLDWYPRIPVYDEAKRAVTEIQLLSYSRMKSLFPTASIWREKVCGFTKSLIAIE